MSKAALVHRASFRVRAGELGPGGRVKVTAILDLMQEAAAQHAEALGRGPEAMMASGTPWILSRLHLVVRSLPPWQEEVTVDTWPSGVLRLFALRELQCRDAAGDVFAEATTGWLTVKLPSKRPLRPDPLVKELGLLAPPRLLDDPFGEIPAPSTLDADTPMRRFTCGRFDLDGNAHANHVAVLRWLLEAAPAPVPLLPPFSLEADLRAEVLEGEDVVAQADASSPSAVLVSLARESDGREVARGRIRIALAPPTSPL